ncbi:hypothetical protein NL676_039814 [Syzygium grande]|nr:hypothetical protein NL676_039814 [Syzygium grande]
METEPCSGGSSVVDKKRKRKRKKSNRNVSDLGMDKENYFPEKNSSVNVINVLPSPAESSSAQENSKAQPCNELNPLPAMKKQNKKKKKKRKIQETSTTQGDIGADVPYYVLKANEPDVRDNITCSSSNSHQSLEHEKSLPTRKRKILAMRRERKKEKRKFFRRMRTEEKLSVKSDRLTEIRNSVSQVAELDKNILKEVSSTSGKESAIDKNLCSLEKEDEDGEAHTLLSDFSNMSTSSKKKSVEKLKTNSRKKPPSSCDWGYRNKYAEKIFQVQTAEDYVSRVDKGIEAAFNCNGEASVDSGLVSCCEHSNGNDVKVNGQIEEVNPSSELLVSEGDIKLDISINKGSMPWQILEILSGRTSGEPSKKKLLILDLNGLLADIGPHFDYRCKPDLMVSRKAVFKRPFVDDFLQFCFEKFAVGVWSSRTKRNLDPVVDFLIGDSKGKLLFCWDQSHCTMTKFTTIENRYKPLVLKELRKLWDKLEPNLPWEKGVYNESNTLLLDDSPYKALCNPANTGIFPYSYHYRDAKDNSLGTGGDLRVYLESLALADDVRKGCSLQTHLKMLLLYRSRRHDRPRRHDGAGERPHQWGNKGRGYGGRGRGQGYGGRSLSSEEELRNDTQKQQPRLVKAASAALALGSRSH